MITALYPSPRAPEKTVVLWALIKFLRNYELDLVDLIANFFMGRTYGFFPYGIKNIHEGKYNLKDLEHLDIPESVTWVGNYAFSHNYSLRSLIINNPRTWIGQDSFNNCYNLVEVNLPKSFKLDQIREGAFDACLKLCLLNFPFKISHRKLVRSFDLCGRNCPCC